MGLAQEGGSTSEARGNGQGVVGSQRDEFDLMRTGSNLPETGDVQLGGSGWDAKVRINSARAVCRSKGFESFPGFFKVLEPWFVYVGSCGGILRETWGILGGCEHARRQAGVLSLWDVTSFVFLRDAGFELGVSGVCARQTGDLKLGRSFRRF